MLEGLKVLDLVDRSVQRICKILHYECKNPYYNKPKKS